MNKVIIDFYGKNGIIRVEEVRPVVGIDIGPRAFSLYLNIQKSRAYALLFRVPGDSP